MDRTDDFIDLGVATVETKGDHGEHLDGSIGQVFGFGLTDE